MIAAVYTLVDAITDEATGVPQFIISVVTPLRSAAGETVFLILAVLIYALIANLTNTVAASFIFIPTIYVLLEGSMAAYIFTALTIFISNVSFLMPSATVNAAMMYNQKQWIPFKTGVALAVFTAVSVCLVMIAVGIPLGKLIF